MEEKKIFSIIEALLFVSEKPLSTDKIYEIFEGEVEKKEISKVLEEMLKWYEQHSGSLCISKVAGGYQMTTLPEIAFWLRKLYKSEKTERLSSPAMETLAIVAYKQPVTRVEIEHIRGVNVEGVLKTLLEKGLIRISGHKKTIGRPILYSTTRLFLEYFGLGSLKELPELKEEDDQDAKLKETQQQLNRSKK